jgi:hypothetical protein
MTQFYDFRKLGDIFEKGLILRANPAPGSRPSPRPQFLGDLNAELIRAGEAFKRHFKQKFDQEGPGWPMISEATFVERDRWGVESDKALTATGALRDSIDYELVGGHLEVGVKDESHDHLDPNGPDFESMAALMMMQEIGYVTASDSKYPGATVPSRKVFTDSDFEPVAERIAAEFADRALLGHRQGLFNWRKA